MYNVAVATGTRAEYGLLRPVLFKLAACPGLRLRLIVTGAHLSAEFGETVREIEQDGLPIAARLDILSRHVPAGRAGTARRTSLALEAFLDYFAAEPADVLLVLGDRYEVFAAAQAAALLDVPVAHISGGDVTYGADDDWFRHCITKMARLHFPSCEEYRRRLICMGEQPQRVFNVGGLGDENIRSMQLPSGEQLAQSLGIELKAPYALVTYHPETATGADAAAQTAEILEAMDRHPQLFYIVTKANADAGGEQINQRLEEYAAQRGNVLLVASLGVLRYLAAMRGAALVLGNSSSGLVETPSFGVPCVNIGQRQQGRLVCENVINCSLRAEDIAAAMERALSPQFLAKARSVKSPYDGGDTSGRIVSALEQALDSGELRQPKVFYDVCADGTGSRQQPGEE